MQEQKRVVSVTNRVVKKPRAKLWAWGLDDFADLLGISRSKLKNLIRDGEVDPDNLESVCMLWLRQIKSPNYKRLWDINPEDAVGKRLAALERKKAKARAKKGQSLPDAGAVEKKGTSLEWTTPRGKHHVMKVALPSLDAE